MRPLCVTALLLCFLALPSKGSQQQKPSDSKQRSATQPQTDSPVSISENHYHASEQGHPTEEESRRWPPAWWSPFWSNWAFFFVGLCAAVAAVWTLFAIKEQATHTRHAAKAGLLTAKEAHKQVMYLSRQLEDFEITQAARLVFEDFQAEIIKGDKFVVDVTIALTNYGATVAHELSMDDQWGQFGSVNLEHQPRPAWSPGTATPRPRVTGPSLGPGKSRIYRFRVGEPLFPKHIVVPTLRFKGAAGNDIRIEAPDGTMPADRVLTGKEAVFINPTVSYTDIFGKPHITTDCYTYRVVTKTWGGCPNLRQRE